ncbi:S1 family peptidase [Allokutzneria oryzae]|uniref:Trypsin-like serine protease n=1 Tax=Allokutzneria oryzae TaxID=1378989 RepID=A0ABV5ZZR5_9PSEU
MRKKSLLVGLLVAATAVLSATPAGAIVGGKKADENYPFMASLQHPVMPWKPNHYCGGAVIAPAWVLTAAHCVDSVGEAEMPIEEFAVRVGSNRTDSGGEVAKAKRVVVHPDYRPAGPGEGNDIALVELAEPVSVRPVALPARTPGPGTPARAIGWGRTCAKDTEKNCLTPPRELKQLEETVVAGKTCARLSTAGAELCVQTPEKAGAICFADSGSPLIGKVDGRWTVLGSADRFGTSNGRDDCDDSTALYADVSAHLSWIARYVR